jgi:hypothetical protein
MISCITEHHAYKWQRNDIWPKFLHCLYNLTVWIEIPKRRNCFVLLYTENLFSVSVISFI